MRNKVFAGAILFFFSVLVLGLFYTQGIKHSLYKELSEKNRIRVLPLEAPRGKIYDRKGSLLVSSRISFDLEIIFQEFQGIEDKEKVINLLSDILQIEKSKLFKKIEASCKSPFIPVKIVENIEKDKAVRIEELRVDLPGVIITTRPLRNYIYKNTLSHLTGYLGKISKAEIRKYRTYGYSMQEFVGKDGIERSYNDYLRGFDGGLQIEVDSKGRQLKYLAVKEPRPGRNLYLSIDIELQKFCSSILADRQGAIVAMNPTTGAVLATVSHPDFDPNIFVSPDNFKEVSNLLNDSDTFPMLNRAISGTYPPGSIFKIVVGTSALESESFDKKKTFSCGGSFLVGNRLFHCWKEEGHGTLHITEAFRYSCNVFFYQLGILVGADEMARYAFKMGLGRPTGIGLPGEVAGFVPTPSWKRKRLKSPWFKGETAHYAIGQGYIVVTPIQILRLVSTVANRGKLVQPYVVERIEDVRLRYAEPQDIGLKEGTVEIVRRGLKDVVNAHRGTGLYARSKEVVIAGKTGTAQNPVGESHAWFAGFAPFENPRISVVVFIEHGGKGGLQPARFAKKIIEKAKRLDLL